ncbi:MAG: CoA-binding protein [Dehalococcoidia bacterium]
MRVDFTKLDRAFNPRSVAVVGDNERRGFQWLRAYGSFQGKLYSVQVNPKSFEGLKALGVPNYLSLVDIPEPIDLAVVAVPRSAALKILDDCIQKDVAAAFFFTAGFAETGTEEGIKLEHALKEKAEAANLHLIGPNCMGLFNPKVGIQQGPFQYVGKTGPLGFISQSGTHALEFSLVAHLQGLDISKSVSFGNGTVLDSPDYLEYFGRDPEIRVIGMYLEGVKNGQRLMKVLKDVSAKKPVAIWKGGRTREGGRAIASHTGSLAMPWTIWKSAVRQCGAVNVTSMEELVDTLKVLLYLPPVRGGRVAITGGSGGQSVAIADVFAETGLEVPQLSKASYDELATFYSLIGGGYPNPIDTGNENRAELKRILEILERDTNTDNIILLGATRWGTPEQIQSQVDLMAEIREMSLKPVLAIVPYSTPEEMQRATDLTQRFQEKAIPSFESIERGARALKNALDYYSFKSSDGA